MQYSIGELSSLLNISRDMIRYYEKQGTIQSLRDEKNNYRTYDTMDVFWLLEAMQHKSWGIKIGKISDIRSKCYIEKTDQHLTKAIHELIAETSYRQILIERLKEIRSRSVLMLRNLGNFWIAENEPYYSCHLVTSCGDIYDRINLSENASRTIFSESLLPFFESGFIVQGEKTIWQMMIAKRYVESLSVNLPDDFTLMPSEICLCTHIDIGEIGKFSNKVFEVLPEYAAGHGYKKKESEEIRGILLGRGTENGTFRRIVYACLPIQ